MFSPFHFTPPFTREHIRDRYRCLMKLWHPDVCRDPIALRMAQAINAEYTAAMDEATRREMPGRSENSYTYQATTNERVRTKIEEAVKIINAHPSLSLEVTGYWLWIFGSHRRGTTAANDEALDMLKAAGYRFSAKKSAWYYATIPSTNHRENDMVTIRGKYGSKIYNATPASAKDELTA
jgi:curved DNA-binding protein CbpA